MFEDAEPTIELVPREPDTPALPRKVQALQDIVFDRMSANVEAAASFGDLDPENPDVIPPEWIAEHGQKEAKRRHRIARYALLNSKEVPFGMKMSQGTFEHILKIKAAEKGGDRTLNVQMVTLNVSPAPPLRRIEVKE